MVTEPQTGFLGSGWTSESEPADAWPEDEERSGGRTRMILLAVAAVAVVLGGTVVGVQALSGSEKPGADCPPTGCVTAASNQPAPPETTPEAADEFDEAPPSDDELATGDETTSATPTPAPASPREQGGVTSAPRPTTTPKSTRGSRPTDDPSPTDDPEATPTAEPLVIGEHRSPVPEQSPSTTAPVPAPVPGESHQPSVPAPPPPPAGGAAIMVGAAVTAGTPTGKSRGRAHTVKLVVAADRAVEDLKVSVPVSGEVTSVTGADWEQTDDSLVITATRGLEAGEELVVTVTVSGEAEIPTSCHSDQGECVVT